MDKLRLIAVFLFFIVSFYPRTNSQEWVKTSVNPGDDRITSSTTDLQGNLYVTGYITETAGGINYCTRKYNKVGQLLWTAKYNGLANGEDKAFGIAIDRLGNNVYVTGTSASNSNNTDIATVMYSASSGNQLAIYRFGDPSNMDDGGFGIAVDRTGNVYITGFITRPGIGKDIYTAKYKSNLNFVWHKTIVGEGMGEDRAFGIITDSLGLNIYIAGSVTGVNSGNDMITVCYDSSGVEKWQKTFNGPGNSDDRAYGIAVDKVNDGGVYVTGYTTNGNSKSDFTTIKYNPENGGQLWMSILNGNGNGFDKAFGIALDNLGSCFITGMSEGTNTGNDFLTVKYDIEGDISWTKRFFGSGENNDSAASIVYSKGNIYVTGYSFDANLNQMEDVVTLKYSANSGDSLQASRINMPANMADIGVKVVTDTAGNVYVSANTFSPASNYDWMVMRYMRGELAIGIIKISSEVPLGFALYQNYPNPFNPSTNIKFHIPADPGGVRGSLLRIKVYDAIGRELETLAEQMIEPGIYENSWDGSGYSSGIYYYQITVVDPKNNIVKFKDTKKMMLVK